MATAYTNVDRVSALMFAKTFGDGLSDRVMDALNKLADERGDELTLDDVRDCLREHLECAMTVSKQELSAPDLDVIDASIQDIRNGHYCDIQEVIDELQGQLDEDSARPRLSLLR